MLITCCKGCEHRSPGCHSTCQDYLAQRAICDAENHERRLNGEAHNYRVEFFRHRYRPFTHDMHKGGSKNNA